MAPGGGAGPVPMMLARIGLESQSLAPTAQGCCEDDMKLEEEPCTPA